MLEIKTTLSSVTVGKLSFYPELVNVTILVNRLLREFGGRVGRVDSIKLHPIVSRLTLLSHDEWMDPGTKKHWDEKVHLSINSSADDDSALGLTLFLPKPKELGASVSAAECYLVASTQQLKCLAKVWLTELHQNCPRLQTRSHTPVTPESASQAAEEFLLIIFTAYPQLLEVGISG